MNPGNTHPRTAPEGFRRRLLLAMMLMVFAITAAVLYLVQENAESTDRDRLDREFQTVFSGQLNVQDVRFAAIAERCRGLAHSVRILAALEENDLPDLYLNAQIELRDILPNNQGGERDSRSLQAAFFRFLNAGGELMPVSGGGETSKPAAWESQLSLAGLSAAQQLGYVAARQPDGTEIPYEVIATPLFSTETGSLLGAIVLGFKPDDLRVKKTGTEARSGIWLNGHLYMPSLPEAAAAGLARAMAGVSGKPADNFTVNVNGEPCLLFSKQLNAGSKFAPAWKVCLYPLADSLARQRQLRWKIIGLGLLVMLGGLAASHFLSKRFSMPVAELAADSAQHSAQRERAEAKLELTYEELRARNTELQQALAELQSAQKQVIQQERMRALGQMASGIAHDFNNALVPILGFCELLQLSPTTMNDRQKALDYIGTIHTAAKDAANVVNRLREFYRPSDENEQMAPVDLKRLVEQSITLTRPKWKEQAQANGATITVVDDLESVPPVVGNESALREGLTNLIFNAVDAMPKGGVITLRSHTDGTSARIEISDTGTGMSEEVRQRCLEPFFSTKGERGTGLGLAMVFGIVQRHGGLLDIRSQQGTGTTFVITLPLQQTAAHIPDVAEHRAAQRLLRVLVVDDEQQVRDLLAAVLINDGHTVELACDGGEGLARFRADRFDLVVTDQAMPDMSGDQLATAVKQCVPNIPVILLTGFGHFLDKEKFPHVDFLVSKPVGIPAFRATIAAATQTV